MKITGPIPNHILALMPDSERQRLGKAGLLASECREIAEARTEKELQSIIRAWLNLHGLYYDQDAMHRRRFGTVGAPDFQLPYKGRFIAWECKADGGKLTKEQMEIRDAILAQGGEWRLIRSLPEAQAHLREIDAAPVSAQNPPPAPPGSP